jgi:uncharacterized membrane-anchored protein
MHLQNHLLRIQSANELHARPFPELAAPTRAAFLAVTIPEGIDKAAAREQLINLLDRHGADHPPAGASHFYGTLGRHQLKWEAHSEFVTYTMFAEGVTPTAFSGQLHESFPSDWLATMPGQVITSAIVRVEVEKDEAALEKRLQSDLRDWFVGESLAAAYVLDRNAVVAGDFRIDEGGHVRFAVLVKDGLGKRRLGRIVQRLLEIETYKCMAMMTLPIARDVFSQAAQLDAEVSGVVQSMAGHQDQASASLDQLLAVSAKIEVLSSTTSFRFSAGRAYSAIVGQRIAVLREERVMQRQLFSEFMLRRFTPAMRTSEAAEKRLQDLSAQAARASDLLATRVGVAAAEQNRKLLERMNQRAALQMRLQETVEGLSVVAVTYYAVNLLGYLLGPLSENVLPDKKSLLMILVLPVALLVWGMIRRIKARVGARAED